MTLPRRKDFRFIHRLRVRWAEVDMQKIVFNAHYLMYFDTAIADYWRALALPYETAMAQLEGDLYVRKATVEYLGSARVDDQLDVAIRCQRIGKRAVSRHFPMRAVDLAGDQDMALPAPFDMTEWNIDGKRSTPVAIKVR